MHSQQQWENFCKSQEEIRTKEQQEHFYKWVKTDDNEFKIATADWSTIDFGAIVGDDAVTERMAYRASPLDIGGTKAAILLQDDLTTVATTMENGVVMLYAVALTNPLAITEETTTFNIGFGLSGSVSVDFTNKDGSDELYITKHGADPVDIKFTAE